MSPAEQLLSVQLEQAGIPFEREYRFAPPRRWRADFAFDWYIEADHPSRFLIEIEGGIGGVSRHLTYTGFTKDAEKYNAAAELGFYVLRYTSRQVSEGVAFDQIMRIIEGRARSAA